MKEMCRANTGEGALSRRTILKGVAGGMAGAALGLPTSEQFGEVDRNLPGGQEQNPGGDTGRSADNVEKRSIRGYVSPLYAIDFELPR
jgi:hypothetical protein